MGITLVFWGGATETKAAARGAKGEFLVALVGPATTLALGGVFWVASTLTQGVISDLLDWLARISVLFAAVNTVPDSAGRWPHAASCRLGDHGSRRTGMRVAGYVGVVIGIATIAYAVWSFSQRNGNGSWLFLATWASSWSPPAGRWSAGSRSATSCPEGPWPRPCNHRP
jgi:hypothetical protein